MKKRSLPPSSLDSDPIIVQPKKRHRERKVNPNPSAKRTSIYKGVTRHRCTGRFEAHLWDKDSWNSSQTKKGRQIYLGAYDLEEVAARSYDLAALKYWGSGSVLNFSIESYINELEEMKKFTKEEYLISLRRNSNGFSRGISKYRGVAKHHQNGRWEARIGRVMGNKYFYLGTYGNQEEAAMAYDIAAIDHRGPNTITNFDISIYAGLLIDKSQNAFAYKRADEITDVEMNTYGNRVKEQAEKAFYRIKHANQYQNLEVSNNYSVQEPVDNGNELVVPMTAVVEPIESGTMEVPTYEEDYYNEESLSHLCRDPAGSMNDNSLSSVFGNPTIEPRNETPALYVVDNSSTWIDEIDFVFNLPVMDRHDQILLLFNRTLYGGYGFDDLLFDDIILNVEDMISTPVHSPVSSEDSFSDQYLIDPVSV